MTAIIAEAARNCQRGATRRAITKSVRLLSRYHGGDVAALVFLAEGERKKRLLEEEEKDVDSCCRGEGSTFPAIDSGRLIHVVASS